MKNSAGRALFPLLALSALLSALNAPGAERARHVIVIGCDGLSPDGIRKAHTPVLDRLMHQGAFSLRARGVMPTSSSPNWASMIMGAGPEQHGVTSNDWLTNKFEIPPIVRGPGGMFPTIFGTLRQQNPRALIACFHDWDGFGRLFERSAADKIVDSDGPTNAVREAIAYFAERRPTFTFIHLDHVDHAGHQFGHGTPEYYAAVESADGLIGEVLEGLRRAAMLERAVILITSDHGGVGKGHGNATLAELEIPWILFGTGVRRGHELQTNVNTYDTAPTLAAVLKITAPDCWIGKPITEAFRRP